MGKEAKFLVFEKGDEENVSIPYMGKEELKTWFIQEVGVGTSFNSLYG